MKITRENPLLMCGGDEVLTKQIRANLYTSDFSKQRLESGSMTDGRIEISPNLLAHPFRVGLQSRHHSTLHTIHPHCIRLQHCHQHVCVE